MADCLFCKISRNEIPAEKVYEDGELFAIKDINPCAPTHLLIIPHRHVETLLDFAGTDRELIGDVHLLASDLAREYGFATDGYRVVANCNRDGGQTVFHVHFHLLAGRPLAWPPG
jgi:histidine triad (HIT) family protein